MNNRTIVTGNILTGIDIMTETFTCSTVASVGKFDHEDENIKLNGRY